MKFGYYRADWAPGGTGTDPDTELQEVKGYTSFTYCEAGTVYHGSWKQFERAMRRAHRMDLKIHLSFNAQDPKRVVESAAPYWDAVELIEPMDEPSFKKNTMNDLVLEVEAVISHAQLPPRKLGAVFSYDQIVHGNGWQAQRLGWRGIEVYLKPSDQVSAVRAVAAVKEVAREQLDLLPSFGDVVVVGMARTLNGKWQNINSLRAVQTATYEVARADSRVTHLRWFDWSGSDGTKTVVNDEGKNVLQPIHRAIAKEEAEG